MEDESAGRRCADGEIIAEPGGRGGQSTTEMDNCEG